MPTLRYPDLGALCGGGEDVICLPLRNQAMVPFGEGLLGMLPAYVVNLAAATGRLAHTERVFSRAGISFQRFDAVDKEKAAKHPVTARLPGFRYRPALPGEIACMLSHYELWQKIAAGSDPFAAIFEDDMLLDHRLGQVLANSEALPPDADLVKLDARGARLYLRRRSVPGPAGIMFRQIMSRHMGTGGYIIAREAAKRLVAMIGDFDVPVDAALFDRAHRVGRRLRAYQTVPGLLCYHPAFDSSIRPEGFAYTETKRMSGWRSIPGKAWRVLTLTIPAERVVVSHALNPHIEAAPPR